MTAIGCASQPGFGFTAPGKRQPLVLVIVDLGGQQGEFARPGVPHPPRQDPGSPAVGGQADPHEGLGETGGRLLRAEGCRACRAIQRRAEDVLLVHDGMQPSCQRLGGDVDSQAGLSTFHGVHNLNRSQPGGVRPGGRSAGQPGGAVDPSARLDGAPGDGGGLDRLPRPVAGRGRHARAGRSMGGPTLST